MKNRTLAIILIVGFLLIFAGGFIQGFNQQTNGTSVFLMGIGFLVALVFAVWMMVRLWKLDISKTTVKMWLCCFIASFAGTFIQTYDGTNNGLTILLITGSNITALICLLRACYLLIKTPDPI